MEAWNQKDGPDTADPEQVSTEGKERANAK